MTNSAYLRSALAKAALELLVPPLVRETLLDEPDFREEYGFRADAVLAFDESGISVKRSDLFKAVRMVLSCASVAEVTDRDGRMWKLKNICGEGELPNLTLSSGKQRLALPDLAALSPDSTIRLRFLDEAASDTNLPLSARNVWRNILVARALEDDEIDAFLKDLGNTPIATSRTIHGEIRRGRGNISILVPQSREYFERLVGVYDGSVTIRDYAASRGKAVFDQLSTWQPYDGFLCSLFLSSHSSMTAEINLDNLGSEDMIRALNFLSKNGDRTSQLGAIEVGLRILPLKPAIQPMLINLIKQMRDADIDRQANGFKLLSALFVLVDGELSRTRLLSVDPPFYRRLAALAQAALIHRQLVNSAVNIDKFCEWAFKSCAEQFYMQSLADMRLEPRWDPDLSTGAQIKADFLGRIIITARNHQQNIEDGELFDLVLTSKSGSLHSLVDPILSYLPGPLEGAEEPQISLPIEIREAIETQLAADEVGPSSFIALVNSALIFRDGAGQAELAATALKTSSYKLGKVEDRLQLLGLLNGLAAVAAIARSDILADELRILIRRYRRDPQYALSIGEAMRVCLVAAASRAKLYDWRVFVGDCLTELAFSDLDGNDGVVLHSHIRHLCHAVPELWVTCGRADAALMAYNNSRYSA